jgi:glycosyltransferase involved in cell wall biosynthesis
LPRLSVVLCSLNGAAGVDRCLRALARQTITSSLELIVVDDGSTDSTSEVARAHSATVIRHATNRGISAARNSGANAASAPIIAFLDDDCDPEAEWAEHLVASYTDDHVIGVGGPLLVSGDSGFLTEYLRRHNPLKPQELALTKSNRLPYRLYLYIRQQWILSEYTGQRDVFSFAGANMSVQKRAFFEIGGFDERIRFGSEDEDLCRRLLHTFPTSRLVFTPDARVLHHFKSSLRDTLRRTYAYGRGSALMYRKWPNVRPTFFPGPVLVMIMLGFSIRFPYLAVGAILMPQALYPKGIRLAAKEHAMQYILDPYLQLIQESCDDIGFVDGLWRYRHLFQELT